MMETLTERLRIEPPRDAGTRDARPWFRRPGIMLPVLLLGMAGALRFWHLSRPPEMIGDESYYAFDAYAYLGGTPPFPNTPPEAIDGELSWVHPPFGKDLIAMFEGPIGFRPIAWRLPSAIAGTLGVFLVYQLAMLLWRSPWWAALAGTLTALDGLHLVMSRIGMLDMMAGTFALAGVFFLVRDRTGEPERRRPPSILGRFFDRRLAAVFGTRSRFWAGFFFGCSVATKWTGVPFLLLAIGLAAIWTARGRLHQPDGRPAVTVVASFLILPAIVYLLAYAPFWLSRGPDVMDFLRLQLKMLSYHLHYDKPQPNASSALSWPFMTHTIRYFPSGPAPVTITTPRILALGNPIVWWGAFLAVPFVAWSARRPDRWRERIVLAGFAAAYLPWLFVSRQVFIYYMTAAVPFMALTLTAALRSLPRRVRTPAGLTVLAATGATFVLFVPVWLALTVGPTWMRATHWLATWH
jgi:dolichyl-phosphate-mannose-protein mannosyltransferase